MARCGSNRTEEPDAGRGAAKCATDSAIKTLRVETELGPSPPRAKTRQAASLRKDMFRARPIYATINTCSLPGVRDFRFGLYPFNLDPCPDHKAQAHSRRILQLGRSEE